MRCKRIGLEAEVVKYAPDMNMEDGFEKWTKVVTQGWIVTDNLVKITLENGDIVCPYIKSRRGYTFICNGDYMITEKDGSKHVCGEDKIWSRYERLE